MMALVGQQMVGGKRAPNGFHDRTLPHFPRGMWCVGGVGGVVWVLPSYPLVSPIWGLWCGVVVVVGMLVFLWFLSQWE